MGLGRCERDTLAAAGRSLRLARELATEAKLALARGLDPLAQRRERRAAARSLRAERGRQADSGKRGGTRVIYYFHDRARPLYLLTMYAKSERADLSADDRRALALVQGLVGAQETSR